MLAPASQAKKFVQSWLAPASQAKKFVQSWIDM
jgi:hypothetical protein